MATSTTPVDVTETRSGTSEMVPAYRRRAWWRRDGLWSRVGAYALLALLCVVILFPVYWMFTISLKTPREINRVPSIWPETVTLDNYRELIQERDFLTAIRNSAIVAGSVTIVSLFISSLAAYSQVRFRYKFRGLIGRLILFGYLMPTSLLFIPLAIIISRLDLGNSLQGLVVVYMTFTLPLATWLLTGYFKGVPAELEEQAMVDGASRLGALVRIVLPLSLPGLAAVSIFTFTAAWNELLLALIFITSEDLRTVSLSLQYLITGDVYRWGPIMAGATLASVPVVVLYFAAQRFMVTGMTAGSVKG